MSKISNIKRQYMEYRNQRIKMGMKKSDVMSFDQYKQMIKQEQERKETGTVKNEIKNGE